MDLTLINVNDVQKKRKNALHTFVYRTEQVVVIFFSFS